VLDFDLRSSSRLPRLLPKSPRYLTRDPRAAPTGRRAETQTPAPFPEPSRPFLLDHSAEPLATMSRLLVSRAQSIRAVISRAQSIRAAQSIRCHKMAGNVSNLKNTSASAASISPAMVVSTSVNSDAAGQTPDTRLLRVATRQNRQLRRDARLIG